MSDSKNLPDKNPTMAPLDPTFNLSNLGEPLTEEDFHSLESSSWIDRQTAISAGLRRVDSFSGAEMVGRKDTTQKSYAGIVFPYIVPGQQYPHSYRLRRDVPEYQLGKGGRPKEANKYLSAPGTRNRLYFPPGTQTEHLAQPELPIIIEGEKKALSLHRLARHQTNRARFLPVSVAGVSNWRGVIGKDYNEKGERVDIKGVIPDFGLLNYQRRPILLAFDADCCINDHVRLARSALAKELKGRGARVRFLDIPVDSGVKGIDELLAAWGPDKVLALIQAAFDSEELSTPSYCCHNRSFWRSTSTAGCSPMIQLTNFEARITAEIIEDDGVVQERQLEIEA